MTEQFKAQRSADTKQTINGITEASKDSFLSRINSGWKVASLYESAKSLTITLSAPQVEEKARENSFKNWGGTTLYV